MATHLSGSKINLSLLRETYRKELLNCLDKCSGSKAVVWDETLTGPFGLIAEYSLLKEHDVDKMYSLKIGGLPASTVQNIIFIVRPKISVMGLVAQNILKEVKSSTTRKECHIIFVPRKSLLCEKVLTEMGVYGEFTNIDEFCLDLIPFDSDLLSMEMDNCYRDCVLYNDSTSLYHAAKSIMTLQALYGIIPSVHGIGDGAKQVGDMIIRMRRQMASHEAQVPSQIDSLLLIDREVDPLTPLLSQLTYEGLIDDVFTINNTSVRLPAEKFARSSPDGQKEQPPQGATSEMKKVILNSGEELYAEIRDKNFNAVGPVLSRKAKLISAQFDERLTAKTVGEMKQFVSKLPHIQAAKQSLATHTTIAELLKEVTDSDDFLECLRVQQEFINGIDTDKSHTFIEDCIAKQEPLNKVLKLMCIQSITNNGLKIKLLEYYRREILQTYGFQHILTLMNLEKAGLLKIQGQRTYPTIKKTLKLVVEDVHEQRPNDISYVFSGFAPLSVRLAQFLARPGWRSIEEVLNMLPGQNTHRVQQVAEGLRKRRNSNSSNHSSSQEQTVTLIFFLGGVTYAEIAALRFLSQAEDGPTEYLIAATKIINSDSFLGALKEELSPPASNPFN